jgi:hypothetical protein
MVVDAAVAPKSMRLGSVFLAAGSEEQRGNEDDDNNGDDEEWRSNAHAARSCWLD